jgi:hypothetical protein
VSVGRQKGGDNPKAPPDAKCDILLIVPCIFFCRILLVAENSSASRKLNFPSAFTTSWKLAKLDSVDKPLEPATTMRLAWAGLTEDLNPISPFYCAFPSFFSRACTRYHQQPGEISSDV